MSREVIANLKFQKVENGDFNPYEFAKMVERAYVDEENSKQFKQKKTFSPSTIGYGFGNCARYWFIAFNGAEFEEKFDAMARANMDNGTAAHERIQKVFGKTGVLTATEVEIRYDDPPIRGFADVLIDWAGKEVVGEIKTAKDEVFALRQAEMKPSPNHLLQILTYMKIRNVAQGFLYYENKNDQTFLIIPVKVSERNKEIINELFEWLRTVYGAFEAGNLPERPFTKSQSACKYCPVKNVCWKEMKNEVGDIEIPAYIPPK